MNGRDNWHLLSCSLEKFIALNTKCYIAFDKNLLLLIKIFIFFFFPWLRGVGPVFVGKMSKSIATNTFYFEPLEDSNSQHSMEFNSLYEGEPKESIKLRSQLFHSHLSHLEQVHDQLLFTQNESVLDKIFNSIDSLSSSSNLIITIINTESVDLNISNRNSNLISLSIDYCSLPTKKQFKAIYSLLLNHFNCNSIEELKNTNCSSTNETLLILHLKHFELQTVDAVGLERLCNLLAYEFPIKCCLLFCSSLGVQAIKFMKRSLICTCKIIEIQLDEKKDLFWNLLENWIFVKGETVDPLDFTSILLTEKLFEFLKDDYQLIHGNISRTFQSLKLLLLEYFWGNPFSILLSRLSFQNSKLFYEFLRFQPSFHCFIETLVYGEGCNKETKGKAIKLLEDDSYLNKALEFFTNSHWQNVSAIKQVSEFLHSLIPEFKSKIQWLFCISRCDYNGSDFVNSSSDYQQLIGLILGLDKSQFLHLLDEAESFVNLDNLQEWIADERVENKELFDKDCESFSKETWEFKEMKKKFCTKIAQIIVEIVPSDNWVFKELFLLSSLKPLQLTMHPSPRKVIQSSLENCSSYFHGSDISRSQNLLHSSKLFTLWKESGKLINISEIFQQYCTLTNTNIEDKNAYTLFMHHLNEFNFIGLIERKGLSAVQLTKQIFCQ